MRMREVAWCALVCLAWGCSQVPKADDPKQAEEPTQAEASESSEVAKDEEKAAPDAVEEGATPKPEDDASKKGCIEDVEAHAKKRFGERLSGELDPNEILDRFSLRDFEDLDGDGQPETQAIVFAYAYNVEAMLYMSGSGCAKHVGDFMVTGLSPLDEKTDGVRGVQAWTKGGCAGLSGDLVFYAWDASAGAFTSAKSVSCGCDPDEEGRDPSCPGM